MVGSISANNVKAPQASSADSEVQRIEKDIAALRKQLQSLEKDSKTSPKEKQMKIKELQDRIQRLEDRKDKAQQNVGRNKGSEQLDTSKQTNIKTDKNSDIQDLLGVLIDEQA